MQIAPTMNSTVLTLIQELEELGRDHDAKEKVPSDPITSAWAETGPFLGHIPGSKLPG